MYLVNPPTKDSLGNETNNAFFGIPPRRSILDSTALDPIEVDFMKHWIDNNMLGEVNSLESDLITLTQNPTVTKSGEHCTCCDGRTAFEKNHFTRQCA